MRRYKEEYPQKIFEKSFNKINPRFFFDKGTQELNLGNILKIIILDFILTNIGEYLKNKKNWMDDVKIITEYLSKGSFGKGFKLILELHGKQIKYFFKINTNSSHYLITEFENYLEFKHPNITKELKIYNYNKIKDEEEKKVAKENLKEINIIL